MSHLPALSGRQLIRALGSLGYHPSHQRGSHVVLRQEQPPFRRLTVPDHEVIAKGTLAAIAREIGLSAPDFAHLLG
ncbi:periplasmic or secreted lipoprotein [Desulfocarbo indianensis]|nr:periplasmic or secreted lipoprotein [Desulfocarbo indianensis]